MLKDIAALPVHDAVAVQQRHERWAVDAMLESWDNHIGHGRARLKVDRPQKTSLDVLRASLSRFKSFGSYGTAPV